MLRNVVTHQDGASIHPIMPASRSTTRTKARRPPWCRNRCASPIRSA